VLFPSPPPLNPHREPIVFVAPPGGPAGLVSLEVRTVDGRLAARTPLTDPAVNPTVRWDGGRGLAGNGQPVADGRYLVRLVGADALAPLEEREIVIDRTPPRVSVQASPPTVPQLADSELTVRVSDTDPGTQFRVLTSTPAGGPRASGPWTPMGSQPVLPDLVGPPIEGHLRVVVQARDQAGNVRDSELVLVSRAARQGPAGVVRRVITSRPWVALTFDDGWSPLALRQIVDIVTVRKVGITLCLNGLGAARWDSALRARLHRAVLDGFVAPCSHGFGHSTRVTSSEAFVESDLRHNDIVDQIIGVTTEPLYRPPWGYYGPGEREAASVLGYGTVLLWSVDPSDYLHPGTPAMVQRVANRVHAGSIVVMHAIPSTAAALPAILDRLTQRGLLPVTVTRLIESGTPTAAG
jgi:peptidoglycan/xylan/chitin deacetylase (PgdA/CDA1 family)